MQALGDVEEPRVAVEHEPPGVDPGAAPVGDQHLQHLGHPAAAGGGVDVPHHRPGQLVGRRRRPGAEPLGPAGREDAHQGLEVAGVHLHLVHGTQISSGTIWIAPDGHSATQMPQPLQ